MVDSFSDAVEKVKNLTRTPSNEELLQLYALYKQATIGDNVTSQPWAIQVKERAKWEAWKTHRGMDKTEAEKRYVELVKDLLSRYI